MEPNEFVQKQIDVNKDIIKVMKITEKQTELQNNINREIAAHVDSQATRIRSLEQTIKVITTLLGIDIILVAILLAVK